jgi:hypothetical protein
MVSQKYFCHCVIKGDKKQNKTKNPKKQNNTKCPKFKSNTVSVSFSECRCSLVVSSTEERKKKRVWRQVCGCLSEAVALL